jgi:hypothetical protein
VYFRAFEMQDFNYGFLACIDGPTGCNSYLYKLNKVGNILWTKNWNGLLRTVVEPELGQYLLTGYTNSFPVLPEALVVRFDTIFDSIPDFVLEINEELSLQVYPNPAQTTVQLHCHQPFSQISLMSIDGRLLHHYTFSPTLLYSLALPPLTNGLFIVRVQTNTGHSMFKKLQIDY